ncbi:MAG: sugar ABC transporter permease [bacterium]|nr:sugar ABC transporter permease [bacterium]
MIKKQQTWQPPKAPWYQKIADGFSTFIPGTKYYATMPARRARTGYMFILPFIIGFLVFMLRPLMESFVMSLCRVEMVPGAGYNKEFIGFDNYRYALQVDPYFNQRLMDEISRMILNTFATLVISFVVAVILNQEFKGRTLARAIFFLPVILSSGVLPGIESQNEFYNMMQGISEDIANSSGVNISAALQSLLRVSGVMNDFFDVLFMLIDSIYDIVMASGIQIIVFLGGLQSVPRSLYEAADVEGCTAWESFWKITFPMVSPLLLVNCIYTIIDFFMKNDNKVMERINEVMYSQFRFAESAAMSWIYFAIAVVFIGICSFIISKGVHYYE